MVYLTCISLELFSIQVWCLQYVGSLQSFCVLMGLYSVILLKLKDCIDQCLGITQ